MVVMEPTPHVAGVPVALDGVLAVVAHLLANERHDAVDLGPIAPTPTSQSPGTERDQLLDGDLLSSATAGVSLLQTHR